MDHSSKITDFVSVIREIDNEFQTRLSGLERERKERVQIQENRILDEVKDQVRKLKGVAVQDFIKSLGTYISPDASVSEDPVSAPSPSLEDPPSHDTPMIDTSDDILCTICQDNLVRTVTLPCRHCFCFECMSEYVKDKIDSCISRKRSIENLIISCPNCKYPYNYLDELDEWLSSNGFNVSLMWGVTPPPM